MKKNIRELELKIHKISGDINYLQGIAYATRKNSERNKIFQKIRELEVEQKKLSKELIARL